MTDPETLDEVAALCRQAERILFVTGAGMSADSGLPTYRGIGGLYHDRHTDEGVPIEVALSGAMLMSRPELTWKYLAEIEAACRGAQPNAGHMAIAELERRKPRVMVLTQNVDGLHRAAGSHNLVEIHGNLHHLLCTECDRGRPVEDFRGMQLPPACPTCGGLMRPNVVLFGEELPASALLRLEHALEAGFDLVCSVGTTSVFPYIAAPVYWARRVGVPTVEINPGESKVSGIVDFRIRAAAAQVLPALLVRCSG